MRRKEERRRYLRLKIIFPVEFRILDEERRPLSCWQQGFTHDISSKGLRLIINVIDLALWKNIKKQNPLLELKLRIPLSGRVLDFLGKVIWSEEAGPQEEGRFFVGLEFYTIQPQNLSALLRFSYLRYFIPRIISVSLLGLLILLGGLYYQKQRVIERNKRIIIDFLQTVEELKLQESLLNQQRVSASFLEERISRLQPLLEEVREEISFWKKKYVRKKETSILKKESPQDNLKKINKLRKKIKELEVKFSLLDEENKLLKSKLSMLNKLKEENSKKREELLEKKRDLENLTVYKMYEWIKNHQNLRTYLVVSFEGDAQIKDWSFTYDQALAIQVFLLFNDIERAEGLINFYLKRAKTYKGGFLNAYYIQDGEPCEYIVHAGPNIWLGLSILKFVEKTDKRQYLSLAERIADFIFKLQDAEGGIRGGPDVEWYSTEHNLDAYAFFKGFYRLTLKTRYLEASKAIERWLKKYSYTYHYVPVRRGRGDSTIATDTYAWSITSLGPEKLKEMGMDAEEIIRFAIENCRVETFFEREGRKIPVEGFDFAKVEHLPRGGVISSEWTAQMVLAFEILSNYFKEEGDLKKYQYYKELSLYYLGELQKMIIASPSPLGQGRACLPYASEENVSTGHGWRTPRGVRTGSVAATAYYLFSYSGYNPLNSEVKPVSLFSLQEVLALKK